MTKKHVGIRLEHVGPIVDADIKTGDLTVLVGPQASGKSIFLQTFKLALDRNHILGFLEQQNFVFGNDPAAMVNGYYGGGMAGMLTREASVTWNGKRHELKTLTRYKRPRSEQIERLFYIPAQRVAGLPSGVTQSFGSFKFDDPYVLRYFAHRLHVLLQNELGSSKQLFPAKSRLNAKLQKTIEAHVFAGAQLTVEVKNFARTLTLRVEGMNEGLSFLNWSAGQREFVPLLLGVHWLCPGRETSRRDHIEWVVIEEPETGLHPQAIEAFLLVVLELMRRSYKVIISTHSTTVLDLVWALRELQACGGGEADVRSLFGDLGANPTTKAMAKNALAADCKVYFFGRGEAVKDISSLDPGAVDPAISDWGGLNGFAGRAAEVVARVVNKASMNGGRK